MGIDFLLLPFSFFNSIHRIWTHNFLFLAVTPGIAAVFIEKRRGAILMGLLVGGMLHLLLDSALDTNPSKAIGVFPLHPFSSEQFSLLNITLPSSETHNLISCWISFPTEIFYEK